MITQIYIQILMYCKCNWNLYTVPLTFDIVSSSGLSTGSAQSTMTSQFQTLSRPVDSLRLAVDADL